jgi:hypothetical protein
LPGISRIVAGSTAPMMSLASGLWFQWTGIFLPLASQRAMVGSNAPGDDPVFHPVDVVGRRNGAELA